MKESNGYPVYKVTQPIRVAKRARYKHPIRIITQPRVSTEDMIAYNDTHRKVILS